MRFPEGTLLLSFITASLCYTCIHDRITKNKSILFVNDTEQHERRLLQNFGYGPIRIHF